MKINTDWMVDARCRNFAPSLFFYDEGSRRDTVVDRMKATRAKAICAGCPVKRECLKTALQYESTLGTIYLGRYEFDYAVRDKRGTEVGRVARLADFTVSGSPPTGVWGGMTARERHTYKIKHVNTWEDEGRTTCMLGRLCRGCREIDDWVDMLQEREEMAS